MPKNKSYQSWCKGCKFQNTHPNACLACVVCMSGDMPMPKPAGFVPEVKE